MRLEKVFNLANVLVKSQLRAGRGGQIGASFFKKSYSLLIIDIAVFIVSVVGGSYVGGLLNGAPEPLRIQVDAAFMQALVLIPLLIPLMVLLPAVLFELSVSSKFASSDTVNWLPVSQSEYTLASALSVAYIYSVVPSLVLGVTLPIALQRGWGTIWADVLVLGLISLFLGSVLVEIIRAAINRVSTVVMKRARKGALFLRLIVTVLVIVVFQLIFNFVFLLQIINGFSGIVGSVQVIPIFWASLSVKYLITGDALRASLFFAGTIGFTLAMLWVAARVRARYWVPMPMTVSVTHAEYRPVASDTFSRLGFSATERAIIRKDLKGLVRRRELIQFFAIPVVFAVVLLFENAFGAASSSSSSPQGPSAVPGFALTFPVFFVSGIFALMISSISFGQEGKSVINIYALPISAREVFRAKLFISLLLSLSAVVGLFTAISLAAGVRGADALVVLTMGILLTIEQNLVGLGFGARYPDFQERPRPRFVEPVAILLAILLGFGLTLVGALPIILNAIFSPPENLYLYTLTASVVFTVSFTLFAYRWANSGVRNLLAEMKT